MRPSRGTGGSLRLERGTLPPQICTPTLPCQLPTHRQGCRQPHRGHRTAPCAPSDPPPSQMFGALTRGTSAWLALGQSLSNLQCSKQRQRSPQDIQCRRCPCPPPCCGHSWGTSRRPPPPPLAALAACLPRCLPGGALTVAAASTLLQLCSQPMASQEPAAALSQAAAWGRRQALAAGHLWAPLHTRDTACWAASSAWGALPPCWWQPPAPHPAALGRSLRPLAEAGRSATQGAAAAVPPCLSSSGTPAAVAALLTCGV
mmetsp:Transcript_34054/g.96501  ORF Transcript_34054/g.96501 Transcript_34054/m.96501 type:complete len:259 (-) Transcript_34054:540-1316(-)